jgi:type I restriction enzyme S subunit
MRGKLVEQRPEEGTGEELYQKILAEKARLVKEGKIKKEKPLPEITEDEKPFEIPESWKWARLGEISNYSDPKTKKAADEISPESWLLDLEDIEKNTGEILTKITGKERKSIGDRVYFQKGEILYSKLRPYLLKILVAPDNGFCSPEIVPFIVFDDMDAYFVSYYLKSPSVDSFINMTTHGIKMPRVGTDTMIRLLVPIPPINEQKRIVKAIINAFQEIKIIETKQDDYKRNSEILRESLLAKSIEGKLVEQRPEEGTGEELYQQIQKEKEKLIKEGKIKKQKPLAEITEKEKPFKIPKNWKWVRWGNLSNSIQYGFNAPAKSQGSIKMVRISDIQDGKINWNTVPFCDISEDEISTYLLGKNDILFARTGGTVGKSYIVKDLPEKSIYAGYLIRTQYSSLLSPEYLYYFMKSNLYWRQLRSGTIATAQPNCNGQTLSKMLLPLPPLAEQKRIVAKLEELLPLCDQLK